jgi:hypothetical protein
MTSCLEAQSPQRDLSRSILKQLGLDRVELPALNLVWTELAWPGRVRTPAG